MQPECMVPLDHNMNDKTHNAKVLKEPCFVELDNRYKSSQGDKFQVQFWREIFARICDSIDGCPEKNAKKSLKLLEGAMHSSAISETEVMQEFEK